MPKRYVVKLKAAERRELRRVVRQGTGSARVLMRAHILLKTDSAKSQPAWTDAAISVAFEVSTDTVERVRQAYVLRGLEAALKR